MSNLPTSAFPTKLTSNVDLALPIKSRAVLDQFRSSCTFKGYIANLTADKKGFDLPSQLYGYLSPDEEDWEGRMPAWYFTQL